MSKLFSIKEFKTKIAFLYKINIKNEAIQSYFSLCATPEVWVDKVRVAISHTWHFMPLDIQLWAFRLAFLFTYI